MHSTFPQAPDFLYRVADLCNRPATATQPAHRGICAISRAQLWRLVAEGRFPAAVKLSPRVTVWRASDVHAWLSGEWQPTPANGEAAA